MGVTTKASASLAGIDEPTPWRNPLAAARGGDPMIRGKKTQELIEHQFRFHKIQQTLSKAKSSTTIFGPWLTLSRQLGAGGDDLARRLAEPLGWRIYDREIIQAIAAQTEASVDVIARRDEQPTSRIDGYLSFFAAAGDPGQAMYVERMKETITSLAERGHAIFLGRGAHCFLCEGVGLRVRIIAPAAWRAERISRRDGVSLPEARRLLHDHDDTQRAFVHQAFGTDIDDPFSYDLVINTSTVDLDHAALLIATALKEGV